MASSVTEVGELVVAMVVGAPAKNLKQKCKICIIPSLRRENFGEEAEGERWEVDLEGFKTTRRRTSSLVWSTASLAFVEDEKLTGQPQGNFKRTCVIVRIVRVESFIDYSIIQDNETTVRVGSLADIAKQETVTSKCPASVIVFLKELDVVQVTRNIIGTLVEAKTFSTVLANIHCV